MRAVGGLRTAEGLGSLAPGVAAATLLLLLLLLLLLQLALDSFLFNSSLEKTDAGFHKYFLFIYIYIYSVDFKSQHTFSTGGVRLLPYTPYLRRRKQYRSVFCSGGAGKNGLKRQERLLKKKKNSQQPSDTAERGGRGSG